MKELEVVKIGGYLINEDEGLSSFLDAFASHTTPRILIHGGGRLATELATRLDIPVIMNEGRRITDEATLQIAVMAYAGWANKQIVAGLQARNISCLGMSGADGDVLRSHRRPVSPIDYGLVGDIDTVNTKLLTSLLSAGITPVICAITHDGNGQLLNTNADTIAAEIAIAMLGTFKSQLAFCFEYPGVLRDIAKANEVIEKMSYSDFEKAKAEGTINKGMIPKLSNGFRAVEMGCDVRICGVNNLWNHKNHTQLCP